MNVCSRGKPLTVDQRKEVESTRKRLTSCPSVFVIPHSIYTAGRVKSGGQKKKGKKQAL